MLQLKSLMTAAHAVVSDSTVFVDSQHKATKRFEFRVTRNANGVFTVFQSAYRIFASGHEVLKSQKSWEASTVRELLEGQFNKSRQGRLFLQAAPELELYI